VAASYRVPKAGYPDAPIVCHSSVTDAIASAHGVCVRSQALDTSAGSYWLRRMLAVGTMTAVCGIMPAWCRRRTGSTATAGQRHQVWHELRQLGAAVREPALSERAQLVCDEMARRHATMSR
jgi:hypothetical protein